MRGRGVSGRVGYAQGVNPRASTDPARAFPVVATLAALDAWQRDPTDAGLGDLRGALHAVVTAVGASGAFLKIHASPMTPLSTGVGTLAERPERDGVSVSLHALRAENGVGLGSLWLDAGAADTDIAVQALELALDAAWSRAMARQTIAGMASLDEATRGIAGVLSVEEVLQVIVDSVRELVRARYAALGIVDERGLIERFITSGVTAEERARIGSPPHGRGLLGLIIRESRSYRIADIATHPDSSGFPANHPPMRSFLGVPVTVKGRSVGNLYLTDKDSSSEFTAQDQRLIEMFALHAGIAIENARLHEQVQRLAVMDERDRIGKDLHDGIIQRIYGVGLSLEDVPDLMDEDRESAVARIDRAIDALNMAIRDIRTFIFGLQPDALDGADFVAGLSRLVAEFRVGAMIEIELEIRDAAGELSVDTRTQLLHIAREALSNAARHSGANHIAVLLDTDDEGLTLSVVDDGRGFERTAGSTAGHFGLANMAARATSVGGALTIDSAPAAGTRIIVRIPAEPPAKGPRP